MKARLMVATVAVLLAGSVHAKTLVFCSEGSPEGFTPALYTAGTTFDASSRQIFNKLVEFDLGTTNIIPGLAESWTVSSDGLEYTFNLRRGVKFHSIEGFTPSRDFNADDVLFSFNRQFSKDHPYHMVSGGNYEYFNGMSMPDLLKSVTKINKYMIKFSLNRPEAPMIANLAMDFASIHSAEYASKMAAAGTLDNFDQNPVGTGPFKMIAYQKDAFVRYKAHPTIFAARQISMTWYLLLPRMLRCVIKN